MTTTPVFTSKSQIPAKHLANLIRRLVYHVDSKTQCWVAAGRQSSNGYKMFHFTHNNKQYHIYAHRLSWLINKGPIGKKHVLHHCDNPMCVNPDHLFLGSQSDNMKDKQKKKRSKSKFLTKQQVIEIFLSADTTLNIARKYNVSSNTVTIIKNRNSHANTTKGLVAPSRACNRGTARKLPTEQLLELYNSTLSTEQLSAKYNVSVNYVRMIKQQRARTDIVGDLPPAAKSANNRGRKNKLTQQQAIEILQSPLPAIKIAKQYGVHISTIHCVRNLVPPYNTAQLQQIAQTITHDHHRRGRRKKENKPK